MKNKALIRESCHDCNSLILNSAVLSHEELPLDHQIEMLKEKTFRATKHGTSFGSTPQPATVTTRIIAFLVGNPSKPLLATVTGRGVDPKHINSSHQAICLSGPTSSHVKSELTRPVLANMSLVPCLFTFASFAVLTHFIHRYMYTQKTTSVEMISY